MSLIRPTLEDENYGVPRSRRIGEGSPEIELLKKSGIIKTSDGIEGHFIDLMNQVGLSPTSVLTRLAMIVEGGETDGVKLGAIKLALSLHMHPAFVPKNKDEAKVNPTIVFNIATPPGAKTQVDMDSVLIPGGQKMESW